MHLDLVLLVQVIVRVDSRFLEESPELQGTVETSSPTYHMINRKIYDGGGFSVSPHMELCEAQLG